MKVLECEQGLIFDVSLQYCLIIGKSAIIFTGDGWDAPILPGQQMRY